MTVRWRLAVVLVAGLTGCATTSPVATTGTGPLPMPAGGPVDRDATPATAPYTGPMDLPVSGDEALPVLDRSGAAGQALECDGEPYGGGGGRYDSGLATVQDDAADALANYLVEEGLRSLLPAEDYRVERAAGGRVLLSYDVDARTKVAFIAADDIRDHSDDVGWGITAWAQCDPAELPARVTESLGIGIWEDARGGRVPSTEVQSYQGPEHCAWQDVTFLQVGPEDEAEQYVRATSREFLGFLRTTFSDDAELPAGARDTGYHREGRELWLAADGTAAYLVALDDPDDVERWPGAREHIGCA